MIEKRLVQIDGDDPGLQRPRQHERLPARPAAEIEDDGIRGQPRQAHQGVTGDIVVPWPLARQSLVECQEGFHGPILDARVSSVRDLVRGAIGYWRPIAPLTNRSQGNQAQTWNELPQPQLLTTFGLLKTNPRFSRPS